MTGPISRTLILLGGLLALPAPAEETVDRPPLPPAPFKPPLGSDRAEPRPAPSAAAEIADPTRISESFRQALERRMPAKNLPGSETSKAAPVAPKLPEISLAASICGRDKDMMQAMLRINGKVELVRAGDKLTVIDKGGLIEIQVLEIQRNQVHVRVMSDALNQELTLH